MRYVSAVLTLMLMGAVWHPITVGRQEARYTIRTYDWTRGCVRTMNEGTRYQGGSGSELAVDTVLVFRNTLQTRDTMTTSTITRDVRVKAGYGGAVNIAVICWTEGAVPVNATARLWAGPEAVVIPLSGGPMQNQVVYATAILIFPAEADAAYRIALSTEHMAVAVMPEYPAQYRVNLELWAWVS